MFLQTLTSRLTSHEHSGFTQCHEHLFIREGVSGCVNPALCFESSIKASAELTRYYAAGGRTLVDAQPVGCGRMSRLLQEVAEITGVHIVASTGFHKLMFYPEKHWIHRLSESALRDVFVHELTQGMFIMCDLDEPKNCTTACAGMIKTAIDTDGLTVPYKTLHTAAAWAALATGASVQCHMETAETAEEMADFYKDQGLPPDRLILAHLDRKAAQLDIMKRLLKKGVYLQLDTIARFKYHDDETECGLIQALIDDGYSHRLLAGLDTTRSRLSAYGADFGLDYILTRFVPYMKAQGVTQDVIDQLFITNPFQALSIKSQKNKTTSYSGE
ncbi:MAG: hypothetical protein EOL87_03585 [Spartobacteria bacterium]|nr:hypothetical protein [Spartobacteria bacterium]